jgi:hypothetical protein
MQELKKAVAFAIIGLPFVLFSSNLASDLRSLGDVHETSSSSIVAITTQNTETERADFFYSVSQHLQGI